ncbi:hypothetical protein J2X61_001902 [Bacillus sp. 3255]|nr:hypothetical protein [Bacillus sp. 3255]
MGISLREACHLVRALGGATLDDTLEPISLLPQGVTGISPVIPANMSPVVRIEGIPPVNFPLFCVKSADAG